MSCHILISLSHLPTNLHHQEMWAGRNNIFQPTKTPGVHRYSSPLGFVGWFFWLLLLNVVSILGCTLGNGCPRWWVQLLALWQVPSAALGDRGKGPYRMEVTILPRVQPLWSRHRPAVLCGFLRVRGSMTVKGERQIHLLFAPKEMQSLENCWKTEYYTACRSVRRHLPSKKKKKSSC